MREYVVVRRWVVEAETNAEALLQATPDTHDDVQVTLKEPKPQMLAVKRHIVRAIFEEHIGEELQPGQLLKLIADHMGVPPERINVDSMKASVLSAVRLGTVIRCKGLPVRYTYQSDESARIKRNAGNSRENAGWRGLQADD